MDNISILIGLVAAALIAVIINYFVKNNYKWRNGPPGPPRFPLIGSLLEFWPYRKLLRSKAIAEFSKKYGDVWRLQMGLKNFVIISSCDALHDILAREEANVRDLSSGFLHELSLGENLGILTAEGHTLKMNKEWVIKNLKTLGADKDTGLEAVVLKHTQIIHDNFLEGIAAAKGSKPFYHLKVKEDVFLLPLSKAIFQFVIGDRVSNDSHGAEFEKLVQMNVEMLKSMDSIGAGVEVAFPFISRFLPYRKQQKEFNEACRRAAVPVIDGIKAAYGSTSRVAATDEDPPSLTHALTQELITDVPCGDDSYASLYRDLLITSGPPLAALMQGLFFKACVNVQMQRIMVEESLKVVPKGDIVRWEHQKKMPYTEAFILEVHRTSIITPNLIPRRLTGDITYKDYTIPKDTILVPDLLTAHNDSRHWEDPDEFIPERWFRPGTTAIDESKRRLVLAYGSGKRKCAGIRQGEGFAFVFFVNTIRKFELGGIAWEERLKVLDFGGGGALFPLPFNMTVKLRN